MSKDILDYLECFGFRLVQYDGMSLRQDNI